MAEFHDSSRTVNDRFGWEDLKDRAPYTVDVEIKALVPPTLLGQEVNRISLVQQFAR